MYVSFSLTQQFEVGWWREVGSSSYTWFVEAQSGGEIPIYCYGGLNWDLLPNCPNPVSSNLCPSVGVGDYVKFKIDYNSGTTEWIARIACSPGSSTYTEVGARWQFSDGTGTAGAETFRFGDDAGMSDHHHNLMERSTGGWGPWEDMDCYMDYAIGWDGVQIADDHYETAVDPLPDPAVC
jgi:hypothetical protein